MERLLCEWKSSLLSSTSGALAAKAEHLVTDGFYPYYFSQPVRVLFIGRECLDIEGCNYLELLCQSYRLTKKIGEILLDQNHFHRRMLKCAYGLVNGRPDWDDIPEASTIGDAFATSSGISFAFTNLCKISNESGEWKADAATIKQFVKASTQTRNFIEQQVALLQPDLVVALNIGEEIFSLGSLNQIHALPSVDFYKLTSETHESLLFHTFHFSAFNKKDSEFYPAIVEMLGLCGK